MKHKLLIIIIVLIGVSSCKKEFLTLLPPTQLTSGSFYTNLTQFQQAVTASYVPLKTIVNTGIFQDEMRSDNTFFTIYQANRGFEKIHEAYSQFTDVSNSASIPNSPGDRWTGDYSGISRINTILGQLATATFLSQGAKDSISGEISFLRAFYYFDLATHFGGVPLLLAPVNSAEGSYTPRNTLEEVYTQIKADLAKAIPLLPAVTAFPQSGKASKGAAKMLLAYVYMTQPAKDYAKAESELLDITKMSYSLLPIYADVFDPNNKNSRESIFEVQYLSDLVSSLQSNFTWQFIPKSTNSEIIAGYHDGAMSILSGWNVPTAEMVSSYEANDARLPASVLVVEGKISGVEDFTITGAKSPVGYTPTAGITPMYMIKKYFHPPYTISFNTPDDWPVFRYSGALLLLAECLVNENKTAEALPYLNQVRRRAGLPDVAAATADNVANETRHELAFENHRWTDLLRTGKAISTLNAKGVRLKAIYGWILPAAFNVTADKLIYPVPFREVQINNKLTQNPGY